MHILIVLICDTKIRDSHKHAKTCVYDRAYVTPKYGILISTLKHAYIERAYVTPKYGILISTLKYAYIERAYVTPKYGSLISTLKHAYMIVLMRHQNTGFS
jgi:hypothetical protein